jgi:hypothetical protein
MRLVKLFLISVLAFAILIFLISLLLPSKAVIERAGVIEAPSAAVYAQINDLRNWQQWNPWTQTLGGNLQFSEPSSGAGASYSWAGQQPGKVTVLDSDPSHGLHYNMIFRDMKPVNGGLEIKPTADGKGTAIRWYMQTDLGWLPWWKLRGFMADKLMGPQVEEGLTRLKARCESGK